MDTVKVKRHEEKLLRRRDQIRATIRRLERENQELAGQRHLDWVDQARDESETLLLDHLSEGYLRELERIELALSRILSESYGLCIACHGAIEEGRLELFPDTEFCLACQDMREKFEKAA